MGKLKIFFDTLSTQFQKYVLNYKNNERMVLIIINQIIKK